MKGTALSTNNIRIRLTDERWIHITQNHPELVGYKRKVLKTIENPDTVFEGREKELIAVRKYTHYLAIIYKELETDGFVITAFLARRLAGIGKLKILWNKQS